MNNFQRIKNTIASVKSAEELSYTLAVLASEQHRACLSLLQRGKCDMNACGWRLSGCCPSGMIEYLKAECEEPVEPMADTFNRWDFIRHLFVGDVFGVTLKDNTTVRFVKVHQTSVISIFMLESAWRVQMCMNHGYTNTGGFIKSNLNKCLNAEVLALLPDDLVEVILPRKITQSIAGIEHSSVCRLWLPSVAEIFGEGGWAEHSTCMEQNEEQFEWFKDKINRTKEIDGSICCWWSRSPEVYSYSSFWCVTSNGTVDYSHAQNSLGVVFGFCV